MLVGMYISANITEGSIEIPEKFPNGSRHPIPENLPKGHEIGI